MGCVASATQTKTESKPNSNKPMISTNAEHINFQPCLSRKNSGGMKHLPALIIPSSSSMDATSLTHEELKIDTLQNIEKDEPIKIQITEAETPKKGEERIRAAVENKFGTMVVDGELEQTMPIKPSLTKELEPWELNLRRLQAGQYTDEMEKPFKRAIKHRSANPFMGTSETSKEKKDSERTWKKLIKKDISI